MGWRTAGDVAEFLAAAGEYLWRERARNTAAPGGRGRRGAQDAAGCVSAGLATSSRPDPLYTDLASLTSNSIYQNIGYRAVEDRVVLAFSIL